MKLTELDSRMRAFETAHDHSVLPGIHMVARLDGRSFTRLVRELCDFEAPFDEVFRDHMVETTRHLMGAGVNVVFAYTQSDEISLLLHRDEGAFGRKLRKLNSVLAGEASALFSLRLGQVATFDCRISQLPREEDVAAYFRWRSEDAHRNALSAHCYWLLRKQGASGTEATEQLRGLSGAEKNELLFAAGQNFNDLPAWQKRGIGLTWESFQKEAKNPKTGETVEATRRRIRVEQALPVRDAFDAYLLTLLRDLYRESGDPRE